MKLVAVLFALATLVGCDDIRIIDIKPHADHRIVAWNQTDLGGGVWGDVSVDWQIKNTGDVSAFVSMVIGVATAAKAYIGSVVPGRIKEGTVIAGTLIILTEGNQATGVYIGHAMPGETETW